MATMQHIISFMRFLQREGIYNSYFENYNNVKAVKWRREEMLEGRLKDWSSNHFLMYAFEWEATAEGYDFWMRIDKKWIEQKSRQHLKLLKMPK